MATLFEQKAPWIMALLMRDFAFTVEDAAAVLGNIGHECGGFLLFQEQKPLVKGSRGGFGWCQWTGPRRVAFEAYAARNGFDLKSDQANYGYLFVELRSTESAAVGAVKAAKTLSEKVQAFEKKFERSAKPNYPSRNKWAQKALAAYNAASSVALPAWAGGSKPAVVAEVPLPPKTDPVAAKVPERDSAVVVAVPKDSAPSAPAPTASHPAAWGTILALLTALGTLILKFFGVH